MRYEIEQGQLCRPQFFFILINGAIRCSHLFFIRYVSLDA